MGQLDPQVYLVGEANQAWSVEDVVWTHVVGAVAIARDLTKTLPDNWGDSGASSTGTIAAGNGYAEFSPKALGAMAVAGLSHGDSDPGYADIDYGIWFVWNNVWAVLESGVWKGYFGAYTPSDRFRVAVEDGQVLYQKNGITAYSTPLAASYPLCLDAALYTLDGGIVDAIIGAATISPVSLLGRHDPVVAMVGQSTERRFNP